MMILASAGGKRVPVIAKLYAVCSDAAGSPSSAPRPGKSPPTPDRDAKLDRIDHVLENFPDRTFAFDEFGLFEIGGGLGAGRGSTVDPD